ncbi:MULTISPECIES: hypothetical protein [unclassified Mameliella]|uniref:hypothetical protein n=1 Tax=unclassified Mameliella TaxID=2630630 RepID=UPI00273E6846|nr:MULTISPECIES: hypothetical protein [unclassified Mameliella]
MSDQLTIILITLAGVLTIGIRYALSVWLPEDSKLNTLFSERRLTVSNSKEAWWLKNNPAARVD